jgi:hypothetical protein
VLHGAVQLCFTFERVELSALAHGAQQALDHQVRRRQRANLGASQKDLGATPNGDAPFEHERAERLWGFALGILRHDSLIMQAKTRQGGP